MKKKELEQQEKPLTIREKLSIHLILLLIKVIKPYDWRHELDTELEKVDKLLEQS